MQNEAIKINGTRFPAQKYVGKHEKVIFKLKKKNTVTVKILNKNDSSDDDAATNLSTESDLRQIQFPPVVVHGGRVGGAHRRRPALHQVRGGGDGGHGQDGAAAEGAGGGQRGGHPLHAGYGPVPRRVAPEYL